MSSDLLAMVRLCAGILVMSGYTVYRNRLQKRLRKVLKERYQGDGV